MELDLNLISRIESESLRDRCDFSIFSGSKVLITGAAGMIGSWLTSAILLASEKRDMPFVTAVSRRSDPHNLMPVSKLPNFRYVRGSAESVDLRGFDYIFHAASSASPTKYQNPQDILQANLTGAENLIELSPNLRQFIYLSSGEVYGSNSPLHVTEDYVGVISPELNRSAYPRAKLETEIKVRSLGENLGFKSTIVRLFHSFGPGLARDDGRSFADFIWAVASGRSPQLYSSGEQIRAFLYLEDAIAGIITATSQTKSTTVNVGSQYPISIQKLAETACEVGGLSKGPIIGSEMRSFEPSPVGIAVPSNNLLCSFGWEQKYSLRESLQRTINWAKVASA